MGVAELQAVTSQAKKIFPFQWWGLGVQVLLNINTILLTLTTFFMYF